MAYAAYVELYEFYVFSSLQAPLVSFYMMLFTVRAYSGVAFDSEARLAIPH
jgi:hypothetical protein